jgi:hypothetical protein
MAFPLQPERLQKVMVCRCVFKRSKCESVVGSCFNKTVNGRGHTIIKNFIANVQSILPFVRYETMKQCNDISLLNWNHKKGENRVSWKGFRR